MSLLRLMIPSFTFRTNCYHESAGNAVQSKEEAVNQSIHLAKLWLTLDSLKDQIDNVAVPLGSHLSLDDPELMLALEELSAKITAHFQQFRLVAQARRFEQG